MMMARGMEMLRWARGVDNEGREHFEVIDTRQIIYPYYDEYDTISSLRSVLPCGEVEDIFHDRGFLN